MQAEDIRDAGATTELPQSVIRSAFTIKPASPLPLAAKALSYMQTLPEFTSTGCDAVEAGLQRRKHAGRGNRGRNLCGFSESTVSATVLSFSPDRGHL